MIEFDGKRVVDKLKRAIQIAHSEQVKTDFSFDDFPKGDGIKYEFDLRVRLPDSIAAFRKNAQKGEKLAPDPKAADTSHMTWAQKAVKKFANATAVIPGHVFFAVRASDKDGKVLSEKQIGYTYAREANLKDARKKPGLGVAGFLQDQAKKDPRYDFSKSFELKPEQMEKLGKFIEESAKNPPNYTWPVAYNCVKFAKKAAKAAGLKNTRLMGLTNLPMGTVAYIKINQAVDAIKKAAKRIEKLFSPKRDVPHVEKRRNSEMVRGKMAQAKGR